MNDVASKLGSILTIITSFSSFIALMFACLPSTTKDLSLKMRIIRGLFYVHPFLITLSIYCINKYAKVNPLSLLWSLAPLVSVAVVWLIFSIPTCKVDDLD